MKYAEINDQLYLNIRRRGPLAPGSAPRAKQISPRHSLSADAEYLQGILGTFIDLEGNQSIKVFDLEGIQSI